jgi:replicative superfamily II helicase
MGRTASHFYISHDSVEIFNQNLRPFMNMAEILSMISSAKEFDQLKVYINIKNLSKVKNNIYIYFFLRFEMMKLSN